MDTVKFDNGNTRIVSHRGLSGLARENTEEAFRLAAKVPTCFGIETDVHRTGDGRFLLCHDGHTGRVSPVRYDIEHTDFDTLRSVALYDMDGRPAERLRLPTLEEYLDACRSGSKHAVLELKSDFTEDELRQILAVIDAFDYEKNMIYISFHIDVLRRLRRVRPASHVQYLIEKIWPDGIIDLLEREGMGLDCQSTLLTAARMRELKARGIEVNCWTVNDAEKAARLVALGVDQITSNILEGTR